jgi:hypothetical protein
VNKNKLTRNSKKPDGRSPELLCLQETGLKELPFLYGYDAISNKKSLSGTAIVWRRGLDVRRSPNDIDLEVALDEIKGVEEAVISYQDVSFISLYLNPSILPCDAAAAWKLIKSFSLENNVIIGGDLNSPGRYLQGSGKFLR